MNEETFVTSIKLTAGLRIDKVTDIGLMTFIYGDVDDFDSLSGEYIGNVSYEITILNE